MLSLRTASLVCCLASASVCFGAERFWNNPLGGNFQEPSNWLNGQAPVPANNSALVDTAIFNLNASYDVTLTADLLGVNFLIGNDTVNLQLNGFTYRTALDTYGTTSVIGDSAGHQGILRATGGRFVDDGANTIIGREAGAIGKLELSGNVRWENVASEFVGWYGAGHINVESGAAYTSPGLIVGTFVGSTGVVTVVNSSITAAYNQIGVAGHGIVSINHSVTNLNNGGSGGATALGIELSGYGELSIHDSTASLGRV